MNPEALRRLSEDFHNVFFLVEASDYERHSLWKEYSKEYDQYDGRVDWKEERRGYFYEIGRLDDRPVCVSVVFASVNGKRVAFYYGCSQLVDHKMIEEWLDQLDIPKWGGGRRSCTDASNFHHCLDAIQQFNKRGADEP
jgi:hypothetical protein